MTAQRHELKQTFFEWGRTFSVPVGRVHSSSPNPRLHSSQSLAATPSQCALFWRRVWGWPACVPPSHLPSLLFFLFFFSLFFLSVLMCLRWNKAYPGNLILYHCHSVEWLLVRESWQVEAIYNLGFGVWMWALAILPRSPNGSLTFDRFP